MPVAAHPESHRHTPIRALTWEDSISARGTPRDGFPPGIVFAQVADPHQAPRLVCRAGVVYYLIPSQDLRWKDKKIMDVSASLMNGAAGFLSLALFVFAWIMNQKFRGHDWSVIPVMIVCLLGSFVLYASTWAPWLANGAGGILKGIVSIFGADMSSMALRMLFSLALVIAVLAIVADCVVDPGYNQAAVWALIIAPITAHGAGGVVGRAFEGLYTAMSLGTLGGLIELLGGN